jgi:hypothetical protein
MRAAAEILSVRHHTVHPPADSRLDTMPLLDLIKIIEERTR